MRVLITGDTGFIGRHLREKYIEEAHDVFGWNHNGIYNYQSKNSENLNLLRFDEVTIGIKKIKPDIIFHCAGSADVGHSIINPDIDMEDNYTTTHNIMFSLKQLEMYDVCFILFSSAAVYGNPEKLPIQEKDVVRPLSPYALHKKASEDVCLFMNYNYDFDVKILRIFSAYGPGLRKQLFWDMYQKISHTGRLDLWGTGNESRDYIYIDDLVRAVCLIAEKAKRDTIVFNVANGEEISIRNAATYFVNTLNLNESIIKFNNKFREGDPINWKADITQLKELGYVPNVKMDEGLCKYVSWCENCNDF